MATAKTIEQQILWSINKFEYMSWGISKKAAIEYDGMATLALRVSGVVHKGWAFISLNEGKDCYEVRLLNVARTKVKRTLEEVYCDNLGEVLDGLIEKDPTLPDDKYRDKAMRDSAKKMGMDVIGVSKHKTKETMAKNEVKFRPATMAEIEGRDTDLYMDGEQVWVMMVHRSGTIGDGEAKLDYIMLTNMKKVQVEDLQVIDDTLKEQDELPENPMMRQFGSLKSKYKDAILLFRCGDFYETYYEDAYTVAKLLGITLTRRGGNGYYMAGFPHHALDTYLPRIIRAGHRVAICDQLDPPPGPRPKRGESETSNSSDNNQNNSEDKVMTNETMKVTDLIGKSISNGGNAKYTINAIENDKVSVTFQMGDSEGKPMTMGVAQVEKLLQGGWTVQGSEECRVKSEEFATAQETSKAEEPKAKTVKMETEPKPKKEQPAKPKVTMKRKQPQTEEPKREQPQGGRYRFSTYTRPTSDGGTKTLGRIDGLQEGDELLQRGVAEKIHASPMYDRDGERKVWWLSFGKRYVEAGRKVCQALNEGRSLEDCQAIVDAQTEEDHAQSEARRKQNAERKQEREGKAQTAKPQGEKLYSAKEIADLLERVMRGDADALAEVNAIKAKAA